MKSTLKKYLLVICTLLFLHACAGTDRQYIVGGEPTDGSGSGSLPPDAGGGISNEGCKILLSSSFVLKTQLNAGDNSEADPQTNILTSDSRPLPPIPLRFSGTNVTMYGDEFPDSKVNIGGLDMILRQKAGTQATGTYDDAGNVALNNVIFTISYQDKVFPTFTLTTGDSGEIPGAAGTISAKGTPIAEDKSITLVGGFTIPDLAAPYTGKATVVLLSGFLDKIPKTTECVGGNGSGVSLKELTKDKDGKEQEIPLGSDNDLIMGSVFVPEQGKDTDTSSTLFKKIKVLRIRNNTTSAISVSFNNNEQFNYAPSSAKVDPSKYQDVTVTFSSSTKDYVKESPEVSVGVSQETTVGDKKLKVSGVLKKAAAELSLDLGDSATPGLVDLGITPVKVLGSGNNTKISCAKDDAPSIIGRTIKVFNTGVRPLQVSKIVAPVMDDLTDTKVDPNCPSFGNKFQRMALTPISPTKAIKCDTVNVGGHTYIKDSCTLPPASSADMSILPDYLQFKAVYIPQNAKSIITNTKDSAKLTILTDNDPSYTSDKPFTVALQAGLSKDTSDSVGLKKVSDTGVESALKISNKQRISINEDSNQQEGVIQTFVILNGSSDSLQKVKISFSDDLDKNSFMLCKSGSDGKVDSSTCNYSNPDIVASVPPMAAVEGKAYFAIKFKPNTNKPIDGPFRQTLNISYEPSSALGATNNFIVGINGTKGYAPLTGNVQMKVDFLSTYIYNNIVGDKPTNSVDFRDPDFNKIKSGSLRLNLTDVDPTDPSHSLMYVTVYNKQGREDNSFKIQSVMSAAERREFVRLPTNRSMSCPMDGGGNPIHKGSTSDADVTAGCPVGNDKLSLGRCNEPENIDDSYHAWDCAYFYYVVKNTEGQKGKIVGIYNNETGEMTLPNLDMHVMNPYHGGAVAGYAASKKSSGNYKTDSHISVTFTTSLLKKYTVNNNGEEIDYVPAGQDQVPNIFISGDVFSQHVSNFPPCPEDWDPTKSSVKPADKENYSPTPEFLCYVNPRNSNDSPAFMKGLPAVAAPNGERGIVLVGVTHFASNSAQGHESDQIPFYMDNSPMWVAFQGRLKQCLKDDWSDCPEEAMTK